MDKIFKDFDWKNGILSKEQQEYIDAFARNQIEIYLHGQTDEALAEKHIKAVYKQLGKEQPRVEWFDSPIGLIDSVRGSIRASVSDSIRASVSDSVRGSIRASVSDSIRASVSDSIWNSVSDSIWNSVRVSIWDSILDIVGASISGSVGGSVIDSVIDSVSDSVRSFFDSGWCSNHKFYSQEFEKNALDDWCKYSEQVSGGVLTNDIAYLIRKPIKLITNNAGRLHYDHDMAIQWSDGTGFYYLNGVEFPKDKWERIISQEVTLQEFANMDLYDDQRVAALQMLRPDRLLEQVNAELIHTGERGAGLYMVPDFINSGETEYCLKFEHPTIQGREYIEWVHPNVGKLGDADKAMASNRHITKQQYLNAVIA